MGGIVRCMSLKTAEGGGRYMSRGQNRFHPGGMSISGERVVDRDVVEGDLCLTGVLSSSSSM